MCCSIGGCGTRMAQCFAGGVCTAGVTERTWSDIRAGIPDAILNGEFPVNGSLSFRIGRGDIGEGFLTNVVFNDDGYFFAEDDSVALKGAAKGGRNGKSRQRRGKGKRRGRGNRK